MAVCVHCATPLPDGSNFCSCCGTPASGGDAPDSTTLTPQGREIFGRLKAATEGHYEVVRELGRGGMAVVFLGYQTSLGRPIAIKVLLPMLAYDPEVVARFQREARTQGNLEHPGIISIYEVHHQGGLTFFTMPYVDGKSLRALLLEQPRPPLHKVQRYLGQAAEALAYAHRRGVVHRDVKPDNILLDPERDSVVLTDFGIAKALAAETTLTTPGDLLGTPQYMSPEQGEGKADLDGRSDQYSLGLIGYEMLAGRRPFAAENLAELMYKHRFEEPESLDSLRPDAPAALRDAIRRSIAKHREDRFPSMDAFLAALEGPAWLAPETSAVVEDPDTRPGGVGADTPGRAATGPHTARRSGAWRFMLGGGVIVAGLAAALLFLGPGREWASLGGGGSTSSTGPGADAGAVVQAGDPDAGGATARAPRPLEADPPPADAGAPREDGASEAKPEDSTPDRDRVIAARSEARRARDEAVAAGAEDEAGDQLAALDRRLARGDADLGAGRLKQALAAFRGVTTEYGRLAEDVTPVSESAARAARDSAFVLREAALALAADSLFPAEVSRHDATRDSAEAALSAGRPGEARALYEVAASGYADLVERGAGVLRQRVSDARTGMEQARDTALQAGAERRAPKRMALADGVRFRALEAVRQGREREAAPLFERAREAYLSIAGSIGGAGSGFRAGPGRAAEPELRDLIERFRVAFEREDMERLRTEIYGGAMPRADAGYFRTIFDRADELEARVRLRSLESDEPSARARLELLLFFKQARTRQPRETKEDLELQFRLGPGGWRLQQLSRR